MDHISQWNYFMSAAMLSAKRSKDPSTKCGAAIVNPKGRIVGLGYNGFPNKCKTAFPWQKEGEFMHTKYAYVVHAEANAIMNATADLTDADIFTTLFPCHECAKLIVQAGISRVIWYSDKYHDMDFSRAARRIFGAAGVETISYIDANFAKDGLMVTID